VPDVPDTPAVPPAPALPFSSLPHALTMPAPSNSMESNPTWRFIFVTSLLFLFTRGRSLALDRTQCVTVECHGSIETRRVEDHSLRAYRNASFATRRGSRRGVTLIAGRAGSSSVRWVAIFALRCTSGT
jgi:hypothetical protein